MNKMVSFWLEYNKKTQSQTPISATVLLFIFGKHPDLSFAELEARYPDSKMRRGGDSFAIMESERVIDQNEFNHLGGSVKCAKVLGESDIDNQIDVLSELLFSHYKDVKLDYGLSVYSFSEKHLRPILLKLKKRLRSEGVRSRFINKDFKNITAAQYKSIKEKGVELIIAKTNESFLIGEVAAVQDIDAYSKRDFEKPFRDMGMGMMPPKLAQILINLTGVKGVIWDPFCGGGTLLMEGLLMGHEMIGSDIDSKHIEGAEKNLNWLINNFELRIMNYELSVHDATLPIDKKFEAIAFEGDLGIPHNQSIKPERLNQIIAGLEDPYIRFFQSLKAMKFKGPVAAGLPYFKLRNGQERFLSEAVRQIEKLGFEKTLSLKYSREGQAVGRAIYRFSLQ